MAHTPGPTVARAPATGGGLYAILTLTAAFVAAVAAGLSLMWSLPPWAMFMGWIGYFTRKPSPLEGAWTFVCAVLGLTIGALSSAAAGLLAPVAGPLALPAVVFLAGGTVIATRGLPMLNNLLGYFIGLVTFFAAHLPPAASSVVQLAAPLALGLSAGWFAQFIEGSIRGPRRR